MMHPPLPSHKAPFFPNAASCALQVPPTMRFVLDGEMPEYLLAKDLILQVRESV
jgi:3-isopropylmalate/(R)-2-methylmalate dehydratase large subunit